MGTSEIEPSVSAETVEKVVSKPGPGERIRRKSKAAGHRDGSKSSKGKRSSSDSGRPSSFSKLPEGAKSPGRLSRKGRSSSDTSEPHRHGSHSRGHRRSGRNDNDPDDAEGEGSTSDEESSSSSEEPEYMKTPGSTYSRGSRSLHLSAGSRNSSPSMPPSDGPSSSRGQRRRIKYQAGFKKSHPQEEDPSQTEFEVSNTSGNISTWEMRQRFQREFPGEPVPSDVILRQLYKADKIAAYERIERYKQEFPGEPVPSDEVLKKLYAPVATTSTVTPTPPAPPPMTQSPPNDNGPQMLKREQLLTRQDSESNMTFATEAGWENYGAATKPKSAVPLSIGMMALEEGDEDEEATAQGSRSVRSAPHRAPMPSFEDFMNIDESSSKQQPVKFNNAPLTSSSTHSSGWTPKFKDSPTTKPASTATTAASSWDASFIAESPEQARPKSETRRPKSESNFVVKDGSDFDGSAFKNSKHGRFSPPATTGDAFHDSFNSGNSFGDTKPASSGNWGETPDLGNADTDGISSVGKGSSKKKDKTKTRSGKKKKDKEREKKPKKKKEKTDEKKLDTEEENASSSDDDFFKPKGAPVRKSWWNLDAPETLSPGPETGALERRKTEAWKKREAWKKTARTQSAPLKKHQLTDSFEKSFQGDVFADFQESANHSGLQPTVSRKPARRGKKQLDNSCHEIGFHSSVAGNDPFDEIASGRSIRQTRTALDSSTHSGPKGVEEDFGSFDAFGSSVGNLQRHPPTRSKSVDDIGFDSFFDITDAVEEELPALPVNSGALAPSKREQRQARTTELLREVRSGNAAPSNSQRRNQQGLVDLNGWESEIPSLFRQSEDGAGLELEVGFGNEPMSPLTVRTKTAIHRPLTSRRRGHALR
eukprot:Nitzschia sp. Nitz4//scaffold87_size112219//29092//31719//NITZ4_004068-RA/size112219-processed-gene-0.127-mRNA-1//-1//CDS//3329559351//1673//frame0